MTHAEFITRWENRTIAVDVDRSLALRIANDKHILPKRYQYAHIFWSWIWILSIPGAFALMYFYKWWAGLAILFLVTPGLSSSTKKSAMQFMIDHSLESPEFYSFAVENGVIRIREIPDQPISAG
jgi:uncharacterized membrane protein YdbT with pleckstrin-like domain